MQGVITTVRELAPQIAGVTAGVGAFIGVMKGAKYIKAFAAALAYTKTIVVNLKNYKKLLTTVSAVLAGVKTLGIGTIIKVAAACMAAAAAYASLTYALGKMQTRLSGVNAEMEELGEINTFSFLAEEIADLDVALTQLAWGGASAAVEAIEAVTEKTRNNLRQRLNDTQFYGNQEKNSSIAIIQAFLLERSKLESEDTEKRIAEIRRLNEYLLSSAKLTEEERKAVTEAANKAISQLEYKSFEERLNAVKKTENQIKNERLNIIQSFLARRLNLESEDLEERYAFLREKLQKTENAERFSADEIYLIREELNRKLEELDNKRTASALQAAKDTMRAYSTLFGGLSKLFGVF